MTIIAGFQNEHGVAIAADKLAFVDSLCVGENEEKVIVQDTWAAAIAGDKFTSEIVANFASDEEKYGNAQEFADALIEEMRKASYTWGLLEGELGAPVCGNSALYVDRKGDLFFMDTAGTMSRVGPGFPASVGYRPQEVFGAINAQIVIHAASKRKPLLPQVVVTAAVLATLKANALTSGVQVYWRSKSTAAPRMATFAFDTKPQNALRNLAKLSRKESN